MSDYFNDTNSDSSWKRLNWLGGTTKIQSEQIIKERDQRDTEASRMKQFTEDTKKVIENLQSVLAQDELDYYAYHAKYFFNPPANSRNVLSSTRNVPSVDKDSFDDLLVDAHTKASREGVPFELTRDDVQERYYEQHGFCWISTLNLYPSTFSADDEHVYPSERRKAQLMVMTVRRFDASQPYVANNIYLCGAIYSLVLEGCRDDDQVVRRLGSLFQSRISSGNGKVNMTKEHEWRSKGVQYPSSWKQMDLRFEKNQDGYKKVYDQADLDYDRKVRDSLSYR